MVDLEKAISYVRRRDDVVQTARLAAILWREPPTDSALHELTALRAEDGGYGNRRRGKSGIRDTARVLARVDDLGLRRGPGVALACRFLIGRQEEDGGWDEALEVRDVGHPNGPPLDRTATRVWLTGLCSHVLIRFGYAEAPGTRCPTDFLLAHSDEAGRMGGSVRATGQALPMLAFHPGPRSLPFRSAVSAIENAYADGWSGGYIASLLRCLRDGGLRPGHPLVARALADLERKQRPDGSWELDPVDDGSEVEATIAALRALRAYGRL